MKYLIALSLFFVGCSREFYINNCYHRDISTYSYKVVGITEDEYILKYVDGTAGRLSEILEKKVNCDQFELDRHWYKVKSDIEEINKKIREFSRDNR